MQLELATSETGPHGAHLEAEEETKVNSRSCDIQNTESQYGQTPTSQGRHGPQNCGRVLEGSYWAKGQPFILWIMGRSRGLWHRGWGAGLAEGTQGMCGCSSLLVDINIFQ